MTAVQTPTLNPKLIVPFVQSTRTVLQTMARLSSTMGRPFLKQETASKCDVSGIIGFSGQIEGTVVVGFHMETAKAIVKAFAGADLSPDTPDFADAIGELANMIVGSAKKDLGVQASITIPTVIIGQGHQTARLGGVPCVVIPCVTPVGEFFVEANIKQVAGPTSEGAL